MSESEETLENHNVQEAGAEQAADGKDVLSTQESLPKPRKTWHPRKAADGVAIALYREREVEHLDAADTPFVHRWREVGKFGREGLAVLPDVQGSPIQVGSYGKRGLRRTVGWSVDEDGKRLAVVSLVWLPVLIAVLIALAVVGGFAWHALSPATFPIAPAVGGVDASQETEDANTVPKKEGTIRFTQVKSFTASPGHVLYLSNPSVNDGYYFKFTLSIGGVEIYQSGEWIVAGKADAIDIYPLLSQYSGQTIDMEVAVSTCKAEDFSACSGTTQTVSVVVE